MDNSAVKLWLIEQGFVVRHVVEVEQGPDGCEVWWVDDETGENKLYTYPGSMSEFEMVTQGKEAHGASLAKEEAKWIAKAAKHDIKLNPGDFKIIDGDLYLDGMDPGEWIDAMTMD